MREKESKIARSVRECLKQLNPNMVLSDEEGERHTARTWHRYIDDDILRHSGKVETDMYNDGRIEVSARIPVGDNGSAYYFNLYQVPLSDSIRKRLGLDG